MAWTDWLKLGGRTNGKVSRPGSSDNPLRSEMLDDEKILSGPMGVRLPLFLPFYDFQQSLSETQEMRLAYRKMLSDADVKSALFTKIFGVAALELRINPADRADPRCREQADFFHWNMTRRLTGGFVGFVWSVLIGELIDGFSINEYICGPQESGKWEGKEVLRKVKPKDASQDLVLEVDPYRNITGIRELRYGQGRVWAPDQFIIATHLPMFGNPTGMSDLRAAYPNWWFLDTVIKLRAMGAEKRALPVVAGEYPDPSKMSALERALSMIKSRSWIAIPKDVKLQVLDIAGSAEDYFKSFCDDLRERIVTSILGSTLASMAGRQGQIRGDSGTHKDTADLRSWFLSACIANLLNDQECGLIKKIIDLNYDEVSDYPYAVLGGVEDTELSESLQVDKGLSDLGFQHRAVDIEERYGRQMATSEDETLVPSFLLQGDKGQPPGVGSTGKPVVNPDDPSTAGGELDVPDFFSEGRRPHDKTWVRTAVCFTEGQYRTFTSEYHGPRPPGPGWHLQGQGAHHGNIWVRDASATGGKNAKNPAEKKSSGGKSGSKGAGKSAGEGEDLVEYIKPAKKSKSVKKLAGAMEGPLLKKKLLERLPDGHSVLAELSTCLTNGFITDHCLQLLITVFMKMSKEELLEVEMGSETNDKEQAFVKKVSEAALVQCQKTKEPPETFVETPQLTVAEATEFLEKVCNDS